MSIVVKIIIGIALLITLLLVMALFVKKEFNVQREIVINVPKQKVFDYIKLLKNQNNFSKWASMDPNMIKEFKGIDGTPGFVSAWDSKVKNVGKGEQEILSITEGSRIEFEIHFKKPMESKAKAYMTTDSIGTTQTRVTWGFDSAMKYPMNLMLLFMNMDKMIGADFEIGLNNLKAILEKQ